MKIDTIEKVKEIGNSHYLNLKKEIMEVLELKKDDFVRISIEKIEFSKE
ncbi:MAG: hypothetical protein ACTSRG_20230 [Candidatus Helarchaeota archaeon]